MCKYFMFLAAAAAIVTGSADAAILNADGDFGAQTIGLPVGGPWDPVGGTHTVTAEAQSPFTNVYPDNGMGASFTSTEGNSYLVDFFSPVTANAAPTLYYNVDFRVMDDSGAIRRFQIGQGAGVSDALTFFVSDTTFLVCDSHYGNGAFNSPEVITDQLTPGQWYNVQLEVDLANRAYSGTVASPTQSFAITPRNLLVSWNGTIDNIHTDSAGFVDVDNFALSTTSLSSIATVPPVAKQVINIDFNGVRDGDAGFGATHNGPGAPGGGNRFNGIYADSRGGDDNLAISRTNLLDSEGTPTSVGFSAGPVGADNFNAPVAEEYTPQTLSSLFLDYVFVHSAGNDSDAEFTISGLGSAATADLALYCSEDASAYTYVQGASLGVTTDAGYTWHTVLTFEDVPVVNGAITGYFGIDHLGVLGGLSLSTSDGTIVNVDFDGIRDGDADFGYTYEGPGWLGGGTLFNSVHADSRGGNDNLTITATDLLDADGAPTNVTLSISPVGGDVELRSVLGNNYATESLFGDYVFVHSADNTSDAPFTIDGLDGADTVDLYFYTDHLDQVTVDGATATPYYGRGVYHAGNTLFFDDVPVVNGEVTGVFGAGSVAVIRGLTIVPSEGGSGPVLDGDLNGDGFVGSADLDIVRGAWGQSVTGGPAEGDPSGDGIVGSADLDIVRANWGAHSPASVPEPGTILLVLAGLAGLSAPRKR